MFLIFGLDWIGPALGWVGWLTGRGWPTTARVQGEGGGREGRGALSLSLLRARHFAIPSLSLSLSASLRPVCSRRVQVLQGPESDVWTKSRSPLMCQGETNTAHAQIHFKDESAFNSCPSLTTHSSASFKSTVSPPSLCSVCVYARPLHLTLTLSHPQPRSNRPPSSSGSRNPLLLTHPQSQQPWQQTTAARRRSLPSSSPPPALTDRRPLLRSTVSVSSASFL